LAVRGGNPGVRHVRQVDEEVVRQRPFAVGEHAVLGAAVVGAHHAHAADQHGHFGRGQAHQLRAVEHQLFGADA
jgi:hypothetical protein